jgi:maleylacetoacetate isomerase
MSEAILYDYWRSSACYRVRIALNLLGIPYTTRSIDLLAGDHGQPAYLAVNPQGLVPTLALDGMAMAQSLAIVEYLDEVHPGAGLLPRDPVGRHRVRSLAYAVAMDLHPICNSHVANHVVQITGNDASREEWMHHFISRGLASLEAMLSASNGPFCHGQAPTMADLCLVPQVYNARRWGVDISGLDRIVAIDAVCGELPAFRDAHPDAVKGR